MLKAYKISCEDDDHGAKIRFAARGKDLRGQRTDMCDCEFIDVHVLRAPEFDKYAPGPVTTAQYLANGWYWECSGCTEQLYGDDGPIVIGNYCFCNRDCILSERERWPKDPSKYSESVRHLCEGIDRWMLENSDNSAVKTANS